MPAIIIGCTAAPLSSPPVIQPTGQPATAGVARPAGLTPGGSGQPVRVALNTELTGASALGGELAKKAADIAVEHINAGGGVGGQSMELIVEDAQSSNQGALAALNKAVGEDHVVAMVGPAKSTQIFAIEPRIRELEIPSFLGGTNPTITRTGNPWLFRLRPTDALAGPAIAHFLMDDLRLSKLGILHDSDAFGTTGADLVEQAVKDAGKQVVRRESYKTGDKDFTAQLLSLKLAGVDGLALYGLNIDDNAIILRQIREQGLDARLVGSPSYSQTTLVDIARDTLDGLYVVVDYFPGRTPESQTYLDAWQAKYGTAADGLAGWNWDALHIIRDGIQRAGGDKTKFRDMLHGLKEYKGAVGTITFDQNGDGLHSIDIVQYHGVEQRYIRTVEEAR
jgi:branched-chain amino acid transport system substrate-binding protein